MEFKNSAFVRDVVSQLAAELAQHTDRPVTVELVGPGPHLQARFGSDATNAVVISINPAILKPVRNEDAARELLRAAGYFRLEHQLYPATAQAAAAAQGGFHAVFAVVNDEHGERRAAARDAAIGALLQTLGAYAYRKANRKRDDAIIGVAAPEAAGTFESAAAYIARVNEFAYYLRRHLLADTDADPAVNEALALVPAELKDMSKDDLVEVARSVHGVLSRGIELPRVVTVTPIAELQPVQEVANEEVTAEEAALDELLNTSPVQPGWWQAVMRSRSAFITLGISVFIWLVICLSAGWSFWVTAALTVVFMGLFLGGICYITVRERRRREYEARGEELPPLGANITRCWNGFWGSIYGLFRDIRISVTGGDGIWSLLAACWQAWVRNIWNPFVAFLGSCYRAARTLLTDCAEAGAEGAQGVWHSNLAVHVRTGLYGLCAGFALWTQRTFYLLWQNAHFRLFIVGLPIAVTLSMTYALAAFGSQLSVMQLVMLLVGIAVFLGVSWYYRAQIRAFLTADVFTDNDELDCDAVCRLPVDKETTIYETVTRVVAVDAAPDFLNSTAAEVQEAAQPLRQSLSKLGIVSRDLDNRDTGFDVVDDIERIVFGDVDVLVEDGERPSTRVAIDVIVDCSDSQMVQTPRLRRGVKFDRARKMALAIEAAVTGRRGVSTRIWGYTAAEIFDCGAAGSGRASGLHCGGGNNDAAALEYAAQSVSARNAVTRVVVVISDSQPADCTWGALHQLGWQLTQEGVLVVQVSVDDCDDQPLPWHVVDLHAQTLLQATTDLGHILEAQLAHC